MRNTILIFLAFLPILTGSFFSCKEHDMLRDTKWKFIGTVNTQKNELSKFEPKDCNKCFTFMFISDTKVKGIAFREKIILDLKEKMKL